LWQNSFALKVHFSINNEYFVVKGHSSMTKLRMLDKQPIPTLAFSAARNFAMDARLRGAKSKVSHREGVGSDWA
jgi:hypothetical protein